jgi:hypothetical protein
MASYNLVRLGATQTINNNAFHTFSYGCDNFESVTLRIKKTGAQTSADGLSAIFVTVQAGTETICNRVPVQHFADINQYLAGTGVISAFATTTSTTGEAVFEIDTGTWYLDKGAELIVSVENTCGAVISAQAYGKVNGTNTPSPQKWLYRTDNAFYLPLVECLFGFSSSTLQNSTDNVTLNYGQENVLVPVDASNAVVNAESVGDDVLTGMALLYDGIPRDMQINSSSTSITYLGLVKDVATPQQIKKARKWIPSKFKGLSKKESVVLAQGH